jgi:hypothetical protein
MATPVTSAQVAKARVRPDPSFGTATMIVGTDNQFRFSRRLAFG